MFTAWQSMQFKSAFAAAYSKGHSQLKNHTFLSENFTHLLLLGVIPPMTIVERLERKYLGFFQLYYVHLTAFYVKLILIISSVVSQAPILQSDLCGELHSQAQVSTDRDLIVRSGPLSVSPMICMSLSHSDGGEKDILKNKKNLIVKPQKLAVGPEEVVGSEITFNFSFKTDQIFLPSMEHWRLAKCILEALHCPF